MLAVAVALGSALLGTPVAQASTCDLVGAVGSGTLGTAANPYAVADADDLEEVGVDCPLDAHYRQTASFTIPAPAPGASNHTPIGIGSPVFTANPFTGTYDGAGHSITGLTIDEPTTPYQGLFSVVRDATLVHIRLIDVSVRGSQHVGGLAGAATDTGIEDVHVTGHVAAQYRVGGLLGAGAGTGPGRTWIIGASADVDVAAASDAVLSTTAEAGGLVGSLTSGSVIRSSTMGDVTASASSNAFRIGGMVGYLFQGSIDDSMATGDVTATGGTSAVEVGGLVGAGDQAGFSDVFATGSVSGGDRVGGLVGELDGGEISSALATGRVVASSDSAEVGGLIGIDDPAGDEIAGAFWDTVTSGMGSDPAAALGVVEGRSTADLQRFATFDAAGWAIVDGWVAYDPLANPVWGICDGAGYPFLLWSVTSDPCASGVVVPSGDPSAVTVGVASAQAAAVGVAGSVSGVRVRGVEVLPVTVGLSGSVGPRGGVVLTSDGMRVRVASVLGARAGAGVVVPSDGVFEASVSAPLVPGSVVEVWINSTPRLVAAAEVPADGGPVTVAIPTGAPLDGGGPVEDGAHTLELRMFTTDGFEVVATGITIGQVVPTGVAAGEGPAPSPAGVGLLVLLALLGVVAVAKRGLRGSAVSR